MRQHGFTLVELMVVICIAGILIAIATLQFNTYVTKTNIEAQTKMLFSDLMKVRSEALFEKRARAVSITGTQFIVYSSNVASGVPRETKTLKYPIVKNIGGTIVFDTRGLTSVDNGCICVEPSGSPASYDSVILFTTRIRIGKRADGGECKSADITSK